MLYLQKKWIMINNYKVITLCGSTRFKDAYIAAQKRLTLEGNIVISVGLFGHSGDEEAIETDVKKNLDRMHLSKIDMADEIYVINVGGYIGESTKHEIEYASSHGKIVKYLEEPQLAQNGSSECWPTIDDYILALRCPLESLNKLKRFRPYILPDGSLDYWNDKNRIVFRLIDSMQSDYEVGMECALTFKYWTAVQNEIMGMKTKCTM